MKILVLNGVNLNMLGKRDTSLYGTETLGELKKYIKKQTANMGVKLVFKQSNCEGRLCDILQKTRCDGVVLNAGAYSHYSYAIRDCIESLNLPVVEVHITNVNARETFRHTDVLSEVCKTAFVGYGKDGYVKAVEYLCGGKKQ